MTPNRIARDLVIATIANLYVEPDQKTIAMFCKNHPGADVGKVATELLTIRNGLRSSTSQGGAHRTVGIIFGTIIMGAILVALLACVALLVRFSLATWGVL